jgi:hypothetical protein
MVRFWNLVPHIISRQWQNDRFVPFAVYCSATFDPYFPGLANGGNEYKAASQYFTANVRYVESGRCVFRPKLDTDSGANWTLNPAETGQ